VYDAIRLVIADDHALFRQGLRALLACEPDLAIVGEVDRIDDLPVVLASKPCDLLLLDLQMERDTMDDVSLLARRAAVVVLTANDSAPNALRAIRLGARAVVFKRFAVETLVDAIRTVARGGAWIPPNLHSALAAELRLAAANPLTPREDEIARQVASGLRNSEIARALSISEDTVKTHLNRIFRKLGVRNRVELVRNSQALYRTS
jgi:two-component system NarL family response regulator